MCLHYSNVGILYIFLPTLYLLLCNKYVGQSFFCSGILSPELPSSQLSRWNDLTWGEKLKTAFAYLLGLLVISPVATIIPMPILLLINLKRTLFWPGLSGFLGAVFAYYANNIAFQYFDATYHWWSYILCMIPIISNEGRRVQGEVGREFQPEKAGATGMALGIVYALLTHFQ